MCGRFALPIPKKTLEEWFEADFPEVGPQYNIAPGTTILGVVRENVRRAKEYRWGLIPPWADYADHSYRMINARAETVHEKPAFRGAFAGRRLIVPAGGFFEWDRTSGGKRPYYFFSAQGKALGMAGLWEMHQSPDGIIVSSCAIVTCKANDLVGQLHDRMPVILDREKYGRWLDPGTGKEELREMLAPCASGMLGVHPVGRRVNDARNDSPDLLEPH